MTRLLNRSGSLAAALCAALLASCDWFEKNAVQEIAGPVPAGARIKFFHFGVGAPGVNFYADARKMTAIQSATGAELTTGVTYGGVGAGGFYSAIAPGQYTLSGKIAATVDKDLAISSLAATLEDGKPYSFYQSGFYNTTSKTVDAFIVEDAFVEEFDYTAAHVRFVHAVSNANPMTLYARNTATNDTVAVGGEVAYKSAGAFTVLPGGLYDLFTRYAGAGTSAIARTGVTFVAGRVYTIGARGEAAADHLDLIADRGHAYRAERLHDEERVGVRLRADRRRTIHRHSHPHRAGGERQSERHDP